MFELLVKLLLNKHNLVALLAGVAAVATVVTLGMPLLAGDTLNRRMKAVATERERIRARERERMMREQRVTLRQEPKAYMRRVVERFDLAKHLGTEDAKERLTMAGLRGQSPQTAFLFFRLVTPAGMALLALFYAFGVFDDQPLAIKAGMFLGAAYVGIKLPEIYVSNRISKRQKSMRRVWPDALDLVLICVESGMSIEAALRRVSQEISTQSVELAEEFILTTAEMSYLSDRRQAYENLATRTGLDNVRAVVSALIQAEKYGTPVSQALRTLAAESREQRMTEAEKKAAALPPKLTVPMILFFLPVLFVIIIGPAIMTASKAFE